MLRLTVSGICAATIAFVPVHAQDEPPPEIESLIAPTLEVGSGIALARTQIADSDLVAAVATLERVLIANPEANDARLLYASLLCRLDDPAGARVEIDYLRGQAIADDAWAEVTGACGPTARELG